MQKFFSKGSTSNDHTHETIETSPSQFQFQSQNSHVFASGTGPARPLRLVYCDENGKFMIDPEALSVLHIIKGPVAVVSVCGRSRQGKSYILNQILGRSSGFQVASTHRPCTKGLWMWSAPLKRIALDGSEYNLILVDSEGVDAYDQTGTYSIQIFSLAVLLSSMFIYNQMGGIDEAALDHLSLVTQITKHVRVRASGGSSTLSELGPYSPVFVWLLRDFYLELEEGNRKITPRDYLELALSSVQGGGKELSAKNEIRECIRALFPERECFALVRPVNDENELHRLDQISFDKLRPEFRSGLDSLTSFVFEKTRPKQVGDATMTGPVLAGIIQSYLDALNTGAVPTIASSWQSVEEGECRKAYDSAAEVYKSAFDRSKPAEEDALREAHEEAVRKSLFAFNTSAVGAGLVRQKYEKLIRGFFTKEFEDYRRNAYMEADFRCSSAIQNMEKKLRAACHARDAKIDHAVRVLEDMLSDYEKSSHGPGKWQKLATFLQQSVGGLIIDLAKKELNQARSEKNALSLRCRSIEDKMGLLNKQLEASEENKAIYLRRFEDATNDKRSLAEDYTRAITNLRSRCSSLEERCSSLTKATESTKRESLEWKRLCEQESSKQKAEEDQVNAEVSALYSRISVAEAILGAARERAQSAEEEAIEWKRKFVLADQETKVALTKAATVQECLNRQIQQRENVLREEFSATFAEKDEELRDKVAKLDSVDQRLVTAILELKAAEAKMESYEVDCSTQKLDIKKLREKLDATKIAAQSFEREALKLKQEKTHLEQKYLPDLRRFEEAQERCRISVKEAKRATEMADKAQVEAVTAQREKNDVERIAMQNLAHLQKAERLIEGLERQKSNLIDEINSLHVSEMDALSKVTLLESRVEEREQEIESLLKSNNVDRSNTVKVLENLLQAERAARGEANCRAETLSLQLQSTQGKLDILQQEFTSARLTVTALDSKLKITSHAKRSRPNECEWQFVHDMDIDEDITRVTKKSKYTTTPHKSSSDFDHNKDNQSRQTGSEDYTKFTVLKLRQELLRRGFGTELLQLKNPIKKDVLSLYEKHVNQHK